MGCKKFSAGQNTHHFHIWVESMFERIMSPDTGLACCSTSQNRDSSWFSAFMHVFLEVDHSGTYLHASNLLFFFSSSRFGSGVPQCLVRIPVWGGKDPHLRGAAPFPTANGRAWERSAPLFPVHVFFEPILQPLPLSEFPTLRLVRRVGVVAGLRPAHQWEDVRLWFCRQRHGRCAKHWALSRWQQGEQRTPAQRHQNLWTSSRQSFDFNPAKCSSKTGCQTVPGSYLPALQPDFLQIVYLQTVYNLLFN